MADRIQHRRDTAERWATFNPILLEGEIGYVLENPNQHKIGDGVHTWNELPLRGFTGNISQETGNDENAVMSQKATTEKLAELGSELEDLSSKVQNSNSFEKVDADSVKSGYRINYDGSIASDISYSLNQYSVKAGDVFSVGYPSNYGSTSSRLYAIYSDSNTIEKSTVVEVGDVCDGVSGKKVYINIPENGKSLLICTKVLSYENDVRKAQPIDVVLEKLDKKIEDEISRSKAVDERLVSNTEVKVEGVVYNGKSLQYNGSIGNNSYHSVVYYSVKAGEKYHLVQPANLGSTGARMYAFYNNETPSASSCIKIGDEFNSPADFEVEVPQEALLMVVGKVTDYAITVTKYEQVDKLKEFESKLDELGGSEEEIVSYEDMVYDSFKYQKKINSDGSLSDYVYDSLYLYSVEEGKGYKVTGQHIGSGVYLYAFYKSNNLSPETLIEKGEMAVGGIVKDYDIKVTAPSGASCLAVTRYLGEVSALTNPLHAQEEKVVSVDKMSKTKPMYVSVKADDVSVNYKYSTEEDLQIRFTKCGVNKLMQLYSHGFIPNETDTVSMGSPTANKLSGSDWVGPYVMKANNREGTYTGFTGGWHGYNGDQTGTPTGHTESVKVYVDNREKVDGGYYCDSCRIVVTNFIQGGNTKKEDGSGVSILKETVTYLIKDRRVYVSLEMEALEDLSISTYYGMQINNYYGNHIKFVGEDVVEGDWSDSAKTTDKNVRFFVSFDSNGRCVKAQLNEVGLGFKRYSDSSKYAFVSGAKAYYSLVGGSVLTLSEGQKAIWSGIYQFSPYEDLIY